MPLAKQGREAQAGTKPAQEGGRGARANETKGAGGTSRAGEQEWRWSQQAATLSFANPKRPVVLFLEVDRPGGFPEPQQVELRQGAQVVDAFALAPRQTLLRQVPLSVMMYEGIVAGALDFDYAPCSMLVSHLGASRRIWLNITKAGKAAIDDLREKGMINALKLSTEDFQPVTAYQVSEKGMTFWTSCRSRSWPSSTPSRGRTGRGTSSTCRSTGRSLG